MNYRTIRIQAIEQLRKRGIDIDLSAGLPEIREAIEQLTGKCKSPRNSDSAMIRAWVDSLQAQTDLIRVATPPQVFKRGEYHPERHFRQAEIDKQPRQVSVGWDGNGAPWRQGY